MESRQQISEPGSTLVKLETAEFACTLSGRGSPPIVLLHGLGASQVLWREVQTRLSDGHRVLSYDHRGAGRTHELAQREFSLATWSDDLHGILEVLELEAPILVGHSLGAAVALKYALSFPDQLTGLVLMGADPDLSNLAPRMLAAAELIEQIGLEEWIAERWSQNTPFSAASLEAEPAMLDRYREILRANDEADYVRTCRAIASAESLGGRVPELALPTLVIIGAEDDRTLPEHGHSLAQQLPDARVVELADVGHTMPFEAPDEVTSAVESFAEELRG